jgi:transposase
MTRALSLDLRERVVAAMADGASCREAAKTFSVSVASAARWSKRARDTGSAAPRPFGKPLGLVLLPERDWLLARLAAAPDLTVRALRAELETERGLRVGYGAVWRFLAREGLSFKKKPARRRARWRRHQARIDPTRLVFVDETWAKTNMTRTHGRAPRGQRLVAHAPQCRGTTMTFLAALRHDRIDAPCVIDGPINGVLFLAWVQQFLVPALRPGDVVVLDNLGSHKGRAVRRALRAAGAHLLFLPPYSPDLNPIEMMFAKLKTLLRRADERSIAAVWNRIGSLLGAFSAAECANYLRHAGYASV